MNQYRQVRGARPFLCSMLLASVSLPALATAFAADAGPTAPGQGIETVVVTAQKRSETLQKVPVSVQVLDSKKLDQLQVQGFADYVKFLPSVTFAVGGGGGAPTGPGFATVTMRGIASGGDGNHSGSLPTVGIYLDEQPLTTIGGTPDLHLYDVARIEALSGPQGTLYGASSEAGTLRIITNKPSTTAFSATYDLEVNSVDHGGVGYTAEGYVNVPVSDHVAVRLVAWDQKDAGYIDNRYGTRTYPVSGVTINNASTAEEDYNDVRTTGGRLAVKIDLDDSWTITPSLVVQQTKTHGTFGYDPLIGDLAVQHYIPEFSKDRWYQAALTVEGKIGNLDVVYSGGHFQRKIDSQLDYTDYSFFYDTLYGYGAYIYDNSGTPIDPTQFVIGHDKFKKDSHELRISSPSENRFRFVGGLFYERQTHLIEQDYRINGIADSIAILPNQIWLTYQKRTDEDYAAYGEVSYDITPKLTATAGLRAFGVHNSLYGFFGFSDGFSSKTGVSQCQTPFMPFGIAPCVNLDKSVRENGTTYKANLAYHFDDDKMVYATISKGFRPGGINRRGTVPPYDSDTLINYEVGWKTSWLDNTLRINGALFYEEWKDFQFSFLGLNSFTEIRNAGDARVYGSELDVIWKPLDRLTLSGSATWLNSELRTDFCGPIVNGQVVTVCPGPDDPYPPSAPIGTELPTTPKFKANLVARYEFPVGDALIHLQGAFTYQSKSYPDLRVNAINSVDGSFQPVRSLLGPQRAFSTLDLSAGVEWRDIHAELFVTNITDERADLYKYAECTTLVCGYEPYTSTNRPRTVGIKFGQSF